VNNEGRAQRFFQVFVPAEPAIRESWRWLQQIGRAAGRTDLGDGLDDVTRACAAAVPALAGIVEAAPNARFRVAGSKVARLPHRASGRTAMTANFDVHEPRPPADPDSALAFTMEGAAAPVPALLPRAWAPGWNSPQAINKFQQEIGGALAGGDPGVRLLGDRGRGELSWAPPPPASDGGLTAVPLHYLFGSEELSTVAPVVTARLPAPTLALHPETAAELALVPGDSVELAHPGGTPMLTLALRDDLPRRCVGVPRGLPGAPLVDAGARVTLARKGAR
jgi:NADH-quinone oxidoreductase subunit G